MNSQCLSQFASKSVVGSVPQAGRVLEKSKSHKRRIFHVLPPEAVTDTVITKFGFGGDFTDIIMCAKFYINLFRGFDFVKG